MAYVDIIRESIDKQRKYFITECTIGRTSLNTVCIKEKTVSRRHGIIKRVGMDYVIEDCGSKNGIIVNNKRLVPFLSQPLCDGDTILINTTVLVFFSEKPLLQADKKQHESSKTAMNLSTHTVNGLSVIDKIEIENEIEKDDRKNHIAAQTTIDALFSDFDIDKQQHDQRLQKIVNRFSAMMQISTNLCNITQSDILFEKILNNIFQIFPHADRSCILSYDFHTKSITPVAARKKTETENAAENFKISQTIIAAVVKHKRSILVANTSEDKQFAQLSSVIDYMIHSLMYVPIIFKEEILGIITMDTVSAVHVFNRDDLAVLTAIAAQVAIALKNVTLLQQVQKETQYRSHLSRYLSPPIVDGILNGKIPLRLGGEKKYGTVLFCDIIGFSDMAHRMAACEVIDTLNHYYKIITDIIIRNKGTLHKFEGDMIMAFWNVLIDDSDAEMHAVCTGLQMQNAVWLFNQMHLLDGCTPIYSGVGCNTGSFAGGNIGGNDRIEYTVIGDTINIAKRIETLSGRWQVFVSESTFAALKDCSIAIELPPAQIKGKAARIPVFSIRGLQLAPHSLLLCIPVLLSDHMNNFCHQGLITGCTQKGTSVLLELCCTMTLHEKETVRGRFHLQEILISACFEAVVVSIAQDSNSSSHIRAFCVLGTSDERITDFFCPGFLGKSDKDWRLMNRE